MSDRVSGHPSRKRLATRVALVLGLVGIVAGPAASLAAAAGGVTVTTPFPAVVVEPGSSATFKLALGVPAAQRVDLKVDGAPSGWTVRLRGGGLVIDSAYVDPKTPPDVTLSVDVPQDATAGSTTLKVTATSGAGTDTLPLTIRVAAAAAGDVTLTSDFPELKGPSSGTFSFNLTLKNGTATDATFGFDASGPAGWTVTAKPSGQAQATSIVVQAGSSTTLSVTATPASDVAAGTFPLKVTASGGGKTASADLQVTITGTYTLDVSTPNGVLSTTANAGSAKTFQFTLTNSGTAPITGVTPSASAPTGWKVTFDPATIDTIVPGTPQTITASITPSSDAITGDYQLSVSAKGAEASGSTAIRVTIETPQLWFLAGGVLILAVLGGLYWVFRTYGRR